MLHTECEPGCSWLGAYGASTLLYSVTDTRGNAISLLKKCPGRQVWMHIL